MLQEWQTDNPNKTSNFYTTFMKHNTSEYENVNENPIIVSCNPGLQKRKSDVIYGKVFMKSKEESKHKILSFTGSSVLKNWDSKQISSNWEDQMNNNIQSHNWVKGFDPWSDKNSNNNNNNNDNNTKSSIYNLTSQNWLTEEEQPAKGMINVLNIKNDEKSNPIMNSIDESDNKNNLNNTFRSKHNTSDANDINHNDNSSKILEVIADQSNNNNSTWNTNHSSTKQWIENSSDIKNEIDFSGIKGWDSKQINKLESICFKLKETLFSINDDFIKINKASRSNNNQRNSNGAFGFHQHLIPAQNDYRNKYYEVHNRDSEYDSWDEEECDDGIKSFHKSSTSHFYFIIDIILIICAFYSIFATPFFLLYDSCYSTDRVTTKIEFFIDFIFILDIFLNCFTSYTTFDGEVIKNKKQIWLDYLKSWFAFDLISAIPFNSYFILRYSHRISKNNHHLLFTFSVNRLKILQMIRSVKIVKTILHNKSLSSLHEKLNEMANFSVNLKICFYLFYFILIQHILACVFIIISQTSESSWINFFWSNKHDLYTVYFSSSYFILSTILSIGYGDIVMINLNDKIYSLFLMVFGVLLNSFVITSISMYIIKYDSNSALLRYKYGWLEQINCSYDNMPTKLYDKIYRFWKNETKCNRMNKHVVYNCLPIGLRYSLINEMYKPIIKSFVFFKEYKNSDFILRVILAFKPVNGIRNDIIIKEGEYIEEIIFIKNGALSLQLPLPNWNLQKISRESILKILNHNYNKDDFINVSNETQIVHIIDDNIMDINNKLYQEIMENVSSNKKNYAKILEISRNEHFGEILMLQNQRSPWHVKVKTKKIELFFLSRIDAVSIFTCYPQIWDNIQIKSLYNMEQIQNLIKNVMKIFIKANIAYIKDVIKTKVTNKLIHNFGVSRIDALHNKNGILSNNWSHEVFNNYESKSKNEKYKGVINYSLIDIDKERDIDSHLSDRSYETVKEDQDPEYESSGYGKEESDYSKNIGSKKRKNDINSNQITNEEWLGNEKKATDIIIDNQKIMDNNTDTKYTSTKTPIMEKPSVVSDEISQTMKMVKRNSLNNINSTSLEDMTERVEHNYNIDYQKVTGSTLIDSKSTRSNNNTSNNYSITTTFTFTISSLYSNIYSITGNDILKVKSIIERTVISQEEQVSNTETKMKVWKTNETQSVKISINGRRTSDLFIGLDIPKSKADCSKKPHTKLSNNKKIPNINNINKRKSKCSLNNLYINNQCNSPKNIRINPWNKRDSMLWKANNRILMQIKENIYKNKKNLDDPSLFYQECFREILYNGLNISSDNDEEEKEKEKVNIQNISSSSISVKEISNKSILQEHENNWTLLEKLKKTEQLLFKYSQFKNS